MNNRTTLVGYSTGKESFVSACDLSAPKRCLEDGDTSDYHQIISEDITRVREFDPPAGGDLYQKIAYS